MVSQTLLPPDKRSGVGTVAAVVVTCNRSALLRQCLEALVDQTRCVDEIVVVDNHSDDDTCAMLNTEFPSVTHIRLDSNFGPAGGFAEGLRYAGTRGHRWIWVFNDDDVPRQRALAVLLDYCRELEARRLGMVGSWKTTSSGQTPCGSLWQRGRARRLSITLDQPDGPSPADLMIFSGTLIAGDVVAAIGLPRAEYFIMFEETEYCLRAKKAGFEFYVVPEVLVDCLHLGAAAESSVPFRCYYQTRNHLAMAREHRSLIEVAAWAVRQIKFLAATLILQDQMVERVGLRLVGAWHGLRGISGITVLPPPSPGSDPTATARIACPARVLRDKTGSGRQEEVS